jgi:hypothetical protein
MTRQAILIGFAFSLLATSGCGVGHTLLYEPFGPNSLCDTTNCGARGVASECDDACDAPRGRVVRRAEVCHRVHGEACGACGDPCEEECVGRRGHCGHWGPLTWVFNLFRYRTFPCSGCGERYWGDWYGDPPDCNDPCDHYGNYTGRGRPARGYDEPVVEQDDLAHGSGRKCRKCAEREATRSVATPRTASRAAPPYAPRMISQTDRVVKSAEGAQTPHLATPKRTTEAR